jgi:hypothetical protein
MTTAGTHDDLDAYAQRIADAAPELTDRQRELLGPLLRPAAITAQAEPRKSTARRSKKAA